MKLIKLTTISPPKIKLSNGEEKTFKSYNINEINITIIDNCKDRVEIRITGFPYTIVLWSGIFYRLIGDYTQAQVEEKLKEILGSNPSLVLNKLFSHQVFATNSISAISGNQIPLSSRNVFSSYFTTYSANSAFRTNPTAFIRSLTSTTPTVSGTSTFIPMITSNFMFPYSTFTYPVTAL
jgi:hypothetical protein